ncbi:hypothetical protein [Terrabacter sp. MAHUQ-38]|uniref:hypothetical protein n=1 Tax=unclassified Terrabacter TaxID=2630222 RepID=UPI00165E5452|nr:hypothetical protein [Terrabacter sp. MAHUQ-38]MBC9820834.1 hypothetical protein [Terrabacter sp. MAHUQ-38]
MPTATTSPHAQTVRALVLAIVASGGATVAHAVGGGHLASGTSVGVGTALLTGATLPFVRRHLSVARSTLLLTALQVAAHVAHGLSAMAAGAHVHGGQPTGAPVLPTHEAHGIRPLGHIETVARAHDATTTPLADLLPSPTMLLAHVVAAVVLGLLLARGERSWAAACALLAPLTAATASLVRALVHRATALGAALGTVTPRRRVPLPTAREGCVPVDVWHARTPVRRGPPALLA